VIIWLVGRGIPFEPLNPILSAPVSSHAWPVSTWSCIASNKEKLQRCLGRVLASNPTTAKINNKRKIKRRQTQYNKRKLAKACFDWPWHNCCQPLHRLPAMYTMAANSPWGVGAGIATRCRVNGVRGSSHLPEATFTVAAPADTGSPMICALPEPCLTVVCCTDFSAW